ncbi:MAG: hypothetical protein ACI8ZB_004271 [Desulforhopalus sp.]|jgi:hypothetical protein
MSKKVRMMPISYVGMAVLAFGIFGDDILGINDSYTGYGSVILTIIGFALIFKGREEYERFD